MAFKSFNAQIPISPVLAPENFFQPAPPQSQQTLTIFGTTLDSNSSPLPACTVELYQTNTNIAIGRTISDGSGNYSFQFSVAGATNFYIVAYKAGSPDVAGTTVNTLVGV